MKGRGIPGRGVGILLMEAGPRDLAASLAHFTLISSQWSLTEPCGPTSDAARILSFLSPSGGLL